MTRSRVGGALALGSLGTVAVVAGCNDPGGTECSCDDPSVRIEVPADRAPSTAGVDLSGRACNGAQAQCSQPAGAGCAEYVFRATGAGTCDVDVHFDALPADYQETVTFVAGPSCCGGFYVYPPSASPIDVADLDAGTALEGDGGSE